MLGGADHAYEKSMVNSPREGYGGSSASAGGASSGAASASAVGAPGPARTFVDGLGQPVRASHRERDRESNLAFLRGQGPASKDHRLICPECRGRYFPPLGMSPSQAKQFAEVCVACGTACHDHGCLFVHQVRWCWHKPDMSVEELQKGLMNYWVPADAPCSVCQALPDDFETCPTCGFLVCCTDECLQDHLVRTCPRRHAVLEASLLGKDDVILRTRHNQSSCERSLTDTPDYPLMKAQAATARELSLIHI